MTFNYVSLFSGIGGFEQALNQLGGTCVMASEIDKYANQAYEVLYGHSTVGDVTKVAAEDVPDHEVLTAGFPCPTFSIAGGRDGMEYQCEECGHEHLITYNDYKNGPECPKCNGNTKPKDIRGLLFFEIARIAEVKKPRALLLENVKGLISSAKGETLRVIAETLSQIGYTTDFDVLNSKFFDLAQNRERVFFCAIRNDLTESSMWNVGKRSDVAAKGKKRIGQLAIKTYNFDWPEQKEVRVKLRDILESDVDEKYFLSDEKTAKILEQLEAQGKTIKDGDIIDPTSAKREGYRIYDECCPTLTARDYKDPRMVYTEQQIGIKEVAKLNENRHSSLANSVLSIDGISPALDTMSGGSREPKILVEDGIRRRIRKLTVAECFKLQGFPDDVWQRLSAAGISNSQGYKMVGNAVSVPVISALGKRLLPLINQ
jgi:DNA (cytosine-5)-methyltransferase 1